MDADVEDIKFSSSSVEKTLRDEKEVLNRMENRVRENWTILERERGVAFLDTEKWHVKCLEMQWERHREMLMAQREVVEKLEKEGRFRNE